MFDYQQSAGKIKRKYKEYEKFWLFEFFHLNTDVTFFFFLESNYHFILDGRLVTIFFFFFKVMLI